MVQHQATQFFLHYIFHYRLRLSPIQFDVSIHHFFQHFRRFEIHLIVDVVIQQGVVVGKIVRRLVFECRSNLVYQIDVWDLFAVATFKNDTCFWAAYFVFLSNPTRNVPKISIDRPIFDQSQLLEWPGRLTAVVVEWNAWIKCIFWVSRATSLTISFYGL